MIYFSGGGWCGTPIQEDKNAENQLEFLESCAWRSENALLGSSNMWSTWLKYFSFDWNLGESANFGILRRDPSHNPIF